MKIGAKLAPLPTSTVLSEQQLEEMIVAAPQILSSEWMLIGEVIDARGFESRTGIFIEFKRSITGRTGLVAVSIRLSGLDVEWLVCSRELKRRLDILVRQTCDPQDRPS